MAKTDKSSAFLNLYFWAFVVLLPFVQLKSLIDATLFPRQIYLGVFLLLLGILLLVLKKMPAKMQFSWSETAFFLFFFGHLISSFSAVNQAEAMASLSRYAGYFAFYSLLRQSLLAGWLQRLALLKAFAVFAAIAVGLTALEIFKALGSGSFWEDIYVIKASYGHKNILSCVLMLCLPFLLMLYSERERTWSALSLVLFFAALIEIFILRTRGIWLSVLVAGLLGLIGYALFLRKYAAKLSWKLWVPALVLPLLVGSIFLSGKGVADQVTDFSNVDRRMVFWENSVEMLGDNALIGVGPGNWKIHFPKYGLEQLDRSVQDGITNIQRPHNDYLWSWTEGGILGIVGFLGFFGLLLYFALRTLLQPQKEQSAAVLIAAAGLIGYMIFSFADFPLERTIAVLSMLSLAALLSVEISEKSFGIKASLWVASILLAGVFTTWVAYYRVQGEKGAMLVLQANAARNPEAILNSIAEAENSFFNMDNFANPLVYFSGTAYAATNRVQPAIAELQLALELHPNHVLSLYTLANLYRNSGRPEEAERLFEKALGIAPLNPRANLGAAELYTDKEDYVRAMDCLNRIPLDMADARFMQLAARLTAHFVEEYETEGKFKGLVQKAKALNASTPETYYEAYARSRQERMSARGAGPIN